jgi:hypothetical protein
MKILGISQKITGFILLMEQSNEHLILEKDLFSIWKEQIMSHPIR